MVPRSVCVTLSCGHHVLSLGWQVYSRCGVSRAPLLGRCQDLVEIGVFEQKLEGTSCGSCVCLFVASHAY